MNRREFLLRIVRHKPGQPLATSSGLDPYRPDQPLSQEDALHLLRRTTFGVSRADLDRAVRMTPGQAVAALFSNTSAPTPPRWATVDPTTESFPSADARLQEYNRRYAELQQWWLQLMISDGFSIREKLVFFWHNHYCSDYLKVYYPQYMYLQNQTFRQMAWGNVRELARTMVADPAMLIYLDNVVSIKGNPMRILLGNSSSFSRWGSTTILSTTSSKLHEHSPDGASKECVQYSTLSYGTLVSRNF